MRIAIGKGRVMEDVAQLLQHAGIDTEDLLRPSRTLFRDLGGGLEAMITRSHDVPQFVEDGACAIGITGLDTLREHDSDLLELLDLGVAECQLCLAGPEGLQFDDRRRHWRVATKFPRLTQEAFARAGRSCSVIKLGGTLETAPESGIADCIVDLVQTGSTLRAHDLVVYEPILDITSYVVASRSSFYRYHEEINQFVERLQPVLGKEE